MFSFILCCPPRVISFLRSLGGRMLILAALWSVVLICLFIQTIVGRWKGWAMSSCYPLGQTFESQSWRYGALSFWSAGTCSSPQAHASHSDFTLTLYHTFLSLPLYHTDRNCYLKKNPNNTTTALLFSTKRVVIVSLSVLLNAMLCGFGQIGSIKIRYLTIGEKGWKRKHDKWDKRQNVTRHKCRTERNKTVDTKTSVEHKQMQNGHVAGGHESSHHAGEQSKRWDHCLFADASWRLFLTDGSLHSSFEINDLS